MNPAFSSSAPSQQDACLVPADSRLLLTDELIHKLRQPLSVIESLAFYLEMTSADEHVAAQLRKIQAMVFEAHSILEHASLP